MLSLIIFVFILCLLLENSGRPRLFPPGPPGLPVIGNLLGVWKKLKKLKCHHKVWQSWSQQYGEILGLRLGFTNIVVVSGKDMIKEVCSRHVFDGRPDGFFYTLRSFDKKLGLVFSDGTSWSTTRQVVLKYLKKFGYGTRSMEINISEECKALVELRLTDAGQPILVNQMFDMCVVNILWRLVAGKRYDHNNDRLKNLCKLITRSFNVVDMSGGVLNFMPLLRYIIPDLIGYTELKATYDSIYAYLRESIREHEEKLDMKYPKDVIDSLLIDIKQNKKGAFTDEELQVVCLDLLQAGMETVANTSVFMLLHLVRNTDVQTKLHREIDEAIGNDRTPMLSDRPRMVYTEAVILETLRISTVPSVGIPHMALEDAKLGNYIIPKGSLILLAMHDLHNGDHWKNPHEFKPERFLTKEGNLMQDDWLMPFGSGRRRCLGEGLARSELFMFLTHLLQKFHLRVPRGDPLPSTEPLNGVSLSAQPFRVTFQRRF